MPRPTTTSALSRQIELLMRLPRFPNKVSASSMTEVLLDAGFSVSKRTVERDLIQLARQFPLVSDERSAPFGWSWSKNAPAMNLARLSNSQALGLMALDKFAAKLLPSGIIEDLAPLVAQAKQQLQGDASPKQMKTWLDKNIVIAPGMPLLAPKINYDVLATCQQALFEQRQLSLLYLKKWESNAATAKVHPLAMIQRGQLTYLLCCFDGYKDPRLLAMHRIHTAKMLDIMANSQAKFKLENYLSEGNVQFGSNKQLKLVATFSADAAAHLEETPLNLDQVMTLTKAGEVKVTATVLDTPQLRWWLLGFGESVTVNQPLSLRREIARSAEIMSKKYQLKKG